MKSVDWDNKILLTGLTIHPDELYLYNKIEWISEPPTRHRNSLHNLEDNHNRNKLSTNATKKLKKSIKYLLYTAHPKKAHNNKIGKDFTFKVNFITLTLSSEQVHSDQCLKSTLLNQFLIEAKNKWNLNNYVWKAERQINGNLHFHILTDTFIPYLELRNCWNRIQNKLGYIDRFTAKYNKKDANSTDIHSLKKIKNIAHYVSKYMSKQQYTNRIKLTRKQAHYREKSAYKEPSVSEGAKKFLRQQSNNGRIWGCSTQLTQLKGGQGILDEKLLKEIESLQNQKSSKRINSEHFSIVLFNSAVLNSEQYPLLYKLLSGFIVERFGAKQEQLIFNARAPIPLTG
jgi:hypothetical protein